MLRLHGREANLIVTLMDERYGPLGHADSNWQQLIGAGIDFGRAQAYPVLQEALDIEATTRMFELTLEDALQKADVVIGQFGMGNDGHTAGILPASAAVSAEGLAVHYHTETFDRITMTFEALKRVDLAYCFAYGKDKAAALKQLHTKKLSLTKQPAQVFKQLPQVYLYNDQIGDKS